MSYRQRNPRKNLLEAVIEKQSAKWGDATGQTARSDALRVLEALVSEIGVEGTISAMDKQGFEGAAYRYLISPMYEEAESRRSLTEEP